jgi:hypothetical protein
MGTGTSTETRWSKHRVFLFQKNKSTADSTSICDIDLVFISFGFENKMLRMSSLCKVIFVLCGSQSAYACLDYIWKKLLDVHCVLYCSVSVRCEATYVISCCGKVLLCQRCWYRWCFYFSGNKNNPFLNPPVSVPVRVSIELVIIVVDRNVTLLTVPVLVTLFK